MKTKNQQTPIYLDFGDGINREHLRRLHAHTQFSTVDHIQRGELDGAWITDDARGFGEGRLGEGHLA